MKRFSASIVLPLLVGLASDPIDIKEWPVAYPEPKTGEVNKFDLEQGAGPHNAAVDRDGTMEKFFSITPIPSGGGTVRHMFFNQPTREIWFGTEAGIIGRAEIP